MWVLLFILCASGPSCLFVLMFLLILSVMFTLLSKQVLFELARYHAPSTIFLDELESVMSQRGTISG